MQIKTGKIRLVNTRMTSSEQDAEARNNVTTVSTFQQINER